MFGVLISKIETGVCGWKKVISLLDHLIAVDMSVYNYWYVCKSSERKKSKRIKGFPNRKSNPEILTSRSSGSCGMNIYNYSYV